MQQWRNRATAAHFLVLSSLLNVQFVSYIEQQFTVFALKVGIIGDRLGASYNFIRFLRQTPFPRTAAILLVDWNGTTVNELLLEQLKATGRFVTVRIRVGSVGIEARGTDAGTARVILELDPLTFLVDFVLQLALGQLITLGTTNRFDRAATTLPVRAQAIFVIETMEKLRTVDVSAAERGKRLSGSTVAQNRTKLGNFTIRYAVVDLVCLSVKVALFVVVCR